jgi:hypothetical protein
MTMFLVMLGIVAWFAIGHLCVIVALRSPLAGGPHDPDDIGLMTVTLLTWPIFTPMLLIFWVWTLWIDHMKGWRR